MDSDSSLEDLKLTKYEGFKCEVKHRSELKNAPYNPRRISDAARKKLRKGIEKLRLLAPVTWNVRTGNLVGGHQRLGIIDQLEGTPDYRLTVAVVDLSEKEEREANLLLNNWGAQGDWDPEKLNEMLPGLDLDATGFDDADVMRMFGDQVDNAEAQKLEEMADRLRAAREVVAKTAEAGARYNTTDFYFVSVFKSPEDAASFLEELGLEANRFQSGDKLREIFRMRRETSAA